MTSFATYVLRDPITRKIRYIGKTKQTLQERLGRHVRDACDPSDRTHRANWIRSLLARGLKPEAVEIHRYETLGEVNEAERMLIKHFRFVRDDLTNATAGGDGCVVPRKPSVADEVVLQAYRSGATTAGIASKFGTCKKRIQRLIKASGLTRKSWSRSKKS